MKLRAVCLLVRWYPAVLVALIAAIQLADPVGIPSMAQGQVEMRFQALRGTRASTTVAVVPITAQCLPRYPDGIPSPQTYVQVVERLLAAGAKAVAVEQPLTPPGTSGEKSPGVGPAAPLPAVIASMLHFERELGAGVTDLVTRVRVVLPPGTTDADLQRAGFLNLSLFDLNQDGPVRVVPLALVHDGRRDLSFAYRAALAFNPQLKLKQERMLERQGAALTLGGAPAGLFDASLLAARLAYSGTADAASFPRIPFSQVAAGTFPAEQVKGRLVLVAGPGTEARGPRQTPFGYLGELEIQANLAGGLLEDQLLLELNLQGFLALLVLFAGIMALIFGSVPLAMAVPMVSALILAAVFASYAAFRTFGLLVPPLPFILAGVLGALFQPLRLGLIHWAIARGAGWLETELAAYRKAVAALDRGDIDKSEELFRSVRTYLNGSSPQSDFHLVMTRLRRGDLETARKEVRGLELNRYDLARLKKLGEDFDKADLLSVSTEIFEHVYLRDNDYPGIARLLRDSRARMETRERAEGYSSLSQLVKDKLQDLQFVGRGGMSLVWKAYDPRAGKVVALKTLTPMYAEDARVVIRFQREVQAMKSLDHPNIAKVYDLQLGKLPYFTMEYLVGEDLRIVLDRVGRLPVPKAINMAKQVLQALEHAHSRGVIHRDIKPENIVLLEGEKVKILDFGVAKLENVAAITRTGAAIGSPWYMAPEQDLGGAVDGRADVYSMGIVLFESLTGQLPYPTSGWVAFDAEPTRPETLSPGLPPALCEIILEAIRRKPEKRLASTTVMLERLAALTT